MQRGGSVATTSSNCAISGSLVIGLTKNDSHDTPSASAIRVTTAWLGVRLPFSISLR